MRAPLLSRPEEITMLTRRIVAIALALCLVIPVAAGAQPMGDMPRGHIHHAVPGVVSGDTKNDLHVQQYEQAISGDTKGDLPRSIAPAPAKPAVKAPDGNSANGWRLAAAIEAALLAAFAIGSAVFIVGRQRRAPHMGM
jgi:hypothetical protein